MTARICSGVMPVRVSFSSRNCSSARRRSRFAVIGTWFRGFAILLGNVAFCFVVGKIEFTREIEPRGPFPDIAILNHHCLKKYVLTWGHHLPRMTRRRYYFASLSFLPIFAAPRFSM